MRAIGRSIDPKQAPGMPGIEYNDLNRIASRLSALNELPALNELAARRLASSFRRCSSQWMLESDLILHDELPPAAGFHDIPCFVWIEYGSVLIVKSDLAVMPF